MFAAPCGSRPAPDYMDLVENQGEADGARQTSKSLVKVRMKSVGDGQLEQCRDVSGTVLRDTAGWRVVHRVSVEWVPVQGSNKDVRTGVGRCAVASD